MNKIIKMRLYQESDRYVVLVLGPALGLLSADTFPVQSFNHSSDLFCDTGRGETTGFYDWMCSASGDLIGVRYMPMWDSERIPEDVLCLSFVGTNDKRNLVEVYFGEDRNVDNGHSIDGEWAGNWVFRSPSGRYAVTFSTEHLSVENRQSLARRARQALENAK